jgi:glutamyl-tRNA synthetase
VGCEGPTLTTKLIEFFPSIFQTPSHYESAKHSCLLAVTGKTSGPSLYHLLQVLGKERVMARIEKALGNF